MWPVHALKPSIHRASEERVWANLSKFSSQSSMVVCEGVARESRATVGWHHIQEVGCEERGDESAHDLEVVGERTYWMFSVHVLQLAWRLARSSLRRALDVGPRGEARSGAPGEGAGAGAWRGGGPGRRGADRYVSVLSRIALVSNENRTIRSNRIVLLFFFSEPNPRVIQYPTSRCMSSWRRTPLLHGSHIILLCAMHWSSARLLAGHSTNIYDTCCPR